MSPPPSPGFHGMPRVHPDLLILVSMESRPAPPSHAGSNQPQLGDTIPGHGAGPPCERRFEHVAFLTGGAERSPGPGE